MSAIMAIDIDGYSWLSEELVVRIWHDGSGRSYANEIKFSVKSVATSHLTKLKS
jgi:hypothetical protein